MTSSAGWKSSRTRPGSSPAACTSARASPAPSSAVVWTSWPQAWATPGTWLRHGSVGGVVDRQRVEVGPQRHQRAGVAQVGDQPGVAGAGQAPADLVEVVADQIGGAGLVPRQLGVGVQVAAQVEEVVGVLVDHRLDEGERSVRGHVQTRLVHRFAGARIRLAVVRREDAVGGGDGRQLTAEHLARAPRRAPGVPARSGGAAARARRAPAPTRSRAAGGPASRRARRCRGGHGGRAPSPTPRRRRRR